jgi:flavin-dependent dehydrogenase
MNTPSQNFDVVIVGGGPAGSSAAIWLAESGAKVLLVEQKRFPRPKLCGEFISPECLVHFRRLGAFDEMLTAGGVRLRETVFYARNGKGVAVPSEWFGQSEESFALGLSRAEMDARLLARARETGVEVLEETQATNLLIEDEKVCGVQFRREGKEEFSIKAKVTIDATGRTRVLARRVEKERGETKRPRARFVAFKTHLEGARAPADQCEIYVYRGGYGGLSRVENGLFNFCFIASAEDVKRCSSDPERVMREVVFTNKRAAHNLCQAKIVEDWQAVSIESFGRGKLIPAEGLLTIGDAAAFIDPFTGSGMLLALESAKIAADAILNALPKLNSDAGFQSLASEYQKQYNTTFVSRLRVCSWLRHIAFAPFLAEAMIAALSLSEGLRRRLVKATRQQTETVSQKRSSTQSL